MKQLYYIHPVLALLILFTTRLPVAAQVPDDSGWDNRFGVFIDGEVYAVAIHGANVYIGGSFTTVEGVAARNVAHWDGQQWLAMGSGIDDNVYSLATDDKGTVYAGGVFVSVGGLLASHIVRWDGGVWSAMGTGVNGSVYTIAMHNGSMYIGGAFTIAGTDTVANGIARWTGADWSNLEHGMNAGFSSSNIPYVYSMASNGTDLYVGGSFITAGSGGDTVNNIARWDGQKWNPCGSGTDASVSALALNGDNLYLGGKFLRAGGLQVTNLAHWNQSTATWDTVAPILCCQVNALIVEGRDLFVGGELRDHENNNTLRNFARWNLDSNKWFSLNRGTDGPTHAMAKALDGIIVVGSFWSHGGENVARWNAGWHQIGNGQYNNTNQVVNAITVDNGMVYAGGAFWFAGNTEAYGVARWDGNQWNGIGLGVLGQVEAVVVDGSNIYAGGRFNRADNIAVTDIAHWDGTKWISLADSTTGRINELKLIGDELYAGGQFTSINVVSMNRIGRWNRLNRTWSPVDSGVRGNFATVYSMVTLGNDLYVAGLFDSAGNVPTANVARWDGTMWHALGNGLNDRVLTMAVCNGEIYAGGDFTATGSEPVAHIARWNGTTWIPLGDGVDNGVNSIVFDGDNLYVGGRFQFAGTIPAAGIAQWLVRYNRWRALGSGVTGGKNHNVAAVAMNGTDLFLGGDFTVAGGRSSRYVARWDARLSSVDPAPQTVRAGLQLVGAPNPFAGSTTISITLPSSGHTDLHIYTPEGCLITTLVSEHMSVGTHTIDWHPAGIAAGIYFYQLRNGGKVKSGQLVVGE